MNNEQLMYLPKLHGEILVIMDEIDRVCRQYNLKYYLVGGSLLGAIRHGGFIPWDDDLDIAMPRKDLEKFIELSERSLDNQFYVVDSLKDDFYSKLFPKVCMKGTEFNEGFITKRKPTGIFIDIFPLDESCAYCQEIEEIKHRSHRWLYILSHKYSSEDVIKEKLTFSKFIKQSIHSAISLLYTKKQCKQKIVDILKSASRYGKTHYANFGSQYKLSKQTMPIEWYGDGTPLKFEDREYMAPTEYLKVVESIYGKNYMQLPPEEKRRCHYPKRVIFSDGTELNFDQPEHFVSINEQEK